MPEPLILEVLAKHEDLHDCSGLLYVPPENPSQYRATRVYDLVWEGEQSMAEAFAKDVLIDTVGDRWEFGGGSILEGFAFFLEYWMKPGVLDLEQRAILDYAASHPELAIHLKGLRIRHRIYVFAEGGANDAAFVRDLCNPAIHAWEVRQAS
ncbi:MAG: hypothetical protein AAGJ79_05000 [Verrucomicrobiota bacterium]